MSNMKESSFLPNAFRGCLISLVSVFLALCLVWLSTSYQYPEHPLCIGGLGAGFPLLFICDAGLGGSPISSWGKITLVDIPNGGIRPGGFLLDFLFYLALVWIFGFAVARIFRRGIHRHDMGWTVFISSIFIAGLLCGSLVFFSSELYEKNYARTPIPNLIIIPSPTPLGTMPSVITPVATVGP
jgi:hypothetical protein